MVDRVRRQPSIRIPMLRRWQDDGYQTLFDLGLLGTLFVSPLFMGGRGPVGKFAFVLCVGILVLGWALKMILDDSRAIRRSGVEWLLLAAVSLVLFQVTPPPMATLLTESGLLALWSAESTLGPWDMATFAPEATRQGLVMLIGYVLLFLLVVQRIQERRDIERLLRWIALATVLMALLGLVQFLFGNGKFLWVFEHPSRDTSDVVKGPFQNQNHFAHMLALGLGPTIWAFSAARDRVAQQSWAIGLGCIGLAGMLTFSRGGIVALCVAAIVCLGISGWKRLLPARAMVVAASVTLAVLIALSIYGYKPLSERLASLRDARSVADASEGRHDLWQAMGKGIADFPWTGTGVGSHSMVYPIYLEKYYPVHFSHGESGYLQVLLEVGSVGLTLLLLGLLISGAWCLLPIVQFDKWDSSRQERFGKHKSESARLTMMAIVILASLIASALHALGDFVWYLSACMSLTTILLACGCRLFQLTQSAVHVDSNTRARGLIGILHGTLQPQSISAPVATALVLLVTVVAGVMIKTSLGPALASQSWQAYLCSNPSDPDRESEGSSTASDRLRSQMALLQDVVKRDPRHARAHLRLAAAYLRLFDLEQENAANPMPLSQLRDAAVASQFSSVKSLHEWIDVAVGPNVEYLKRAWRHCRLGLQQGPLHGEGYIYLADLAFLGGHPRSYQEDLLAQAIRVRPHSGVVRFAAGQQAALASDLSQALTHWEVAFQDPEIRTLIIRALAERAPAGLFTEFFSPDTAALGEIYSHYRKLQRTEDATFIARKYLQGLLEDVKSAPRKEQSAIWYSCQSVYRFLGELEEACTSAERAVSLDPSHFKKRLAFANILLDVSEFEAAVEQFQWCVHRKPADDSLLEQLALAKKRWLQSQSGSRQEISDVPSRELRR